MIVASNVWVMDPKEDKYIRGSEIIEVQVHTLRVTSYGKEVERHSTVKITQARSVDSQAGTAPDTVTLWEFGTRTQADTAVATLLAALSTDPCAVVRLDDNGEVRVQPLAAV